MKALGLTLALALTSAIGTAQVEVREVHWGFDGHVVLERFNLLSIRIENPTESPFDGTARAWSIGEFDPRRVGEVLVEPCFVSPRTSRWLTLLPFVVDGDARWVVELGGVQTVINVPSAGRPAHVRLFESTPPSTTGLPLFDAARFPPTVLALDGLASVTLGDVPDWDTARREAFRQWIYGGGVVHLLERRGGYARFDGDLAVLDGAAATIPYGQGLVRHVGSEPMPADLPATLRPFAGRRATANALDAVRVEVPIRHEWGLLFLCVVLYVFVVGPVHWFLSAKKLGPVASFASLLGIVAVFGTLLHVLGRRSSDEASEERSICLVRPVADDRLQVLSYTNLFVVRGDTYALRPAGGAGLLTTAQRLEPVAAEVHQGREAMMEVEIPLYSHRSLVTSTVVTGTAPHVSLESLPTRIQDLRLRLAAPPSPILDAVVVWRGECARLTADGERLDTRGPAMDADAFHELAAQVGWQDAAEILRRAPLGYLGLAVPDELRPEDPWLHVFLVTAGLPALELGGTEAAVRDITVVHHLRVDPNALR